MKGSKAVLGPGCGHERQSCWVQTGTLVQPAKLTPVQTSTSTRSSLAWRAPGAAAVLPMAARVRKTGDKRMMGGLNGKEAILEKLDTTCSQVKTLHFIHFPGPQSDPASNLI
jgi:hypothetical protein